MGKLLQTGLRGCLGQGESWGSACARGEQKVQDILVFSPRCDWEWIPLHVAVDVGTAVGLGRVPHLCPPWPGPLHPLLPWVLLLWLCVSLSGGRQTISEMAALHFCSISLQPLLL